jgi:hypothetical protein
MLPRLKSFDCKLRNCPKIYRTSSGRLALRCDDWMLIKWSNDDKYYDTVISLLVGFHVGVIIDCSMHWIQECLHWLNALNVDKYTKIDYCILVGRISCGCNNRLHYALNTGMPALIECIKCRQIHCTKIDYDILVGRILFRCNLNRLHYACHHCIVMTHGYLRVRKARTICRGMFCVWNLLLYFCL